MPVAITRKTWQESYVPGLQALETAIVLISDSNTLENARRAFGWAFAGDHQCADGEGGCLDTDGECTWWPSYPQELCNDEELAEYAEDETNASNRKKLLAVASALQDLYGSASELLWYRLRDMDLPVYKAETIKILRANIALLKEVYAIGRPTNSRVPQ